MARGIRSREAFGIAPSLGMRRTHVLGLPVLCAPRQWTVARSEGRSSLSRASSITAGLLPRQDLLKRAAPTDIAPELMGHAIDLGEKAMQEWSVTATEFLRAPERMALLRLFEPLAELRARAAGTRPRCWRKVWLSWSCVAIFCSIERPIATF